MALGGADGVIAQADDGPRPRRAGGLLVTAFLGVNSVHMERG